MNCTELFERQLALDYGCTVQALRGGKNLLLSQSFAPGARKNSDGSAFRVLCYRGALIVCAAPELQDWCREKLMALDAPWLTEPQTLLGIDAALRRFGQTITDVHHYYLPSSDAQQPVTPPCGVHWYEGDQLAQFEDDERFGEALLFDADTPDMLAVTLEDDRGILAMAGASRDSEKLWQIGVNVLPQARVNGYGSCVVTLLKNRLLRQGIVPYYGTVESHFASQRVALKAGFLPTFLELFSEEVS